MDEKKRDKIRLFTSTDVYKKIDEVLWYVLLIASISIMFVLVYRQSMFPEVFNSDIDAYIDYINGIDVGNPFPYPVMFKTAEILKYYLYTPQLAMAITVTIFNVLAMIVVRKIFCAQTKSGVLSSLATVVLFFSSMIFNHVFITLGIPHYYVGVGTPNPWHNATYVAARPFVILSFVLGAYSLLHYESDFSHNTKFKWNVHKYYVYFAIAMFLCTLTKPAYNLPHMGVVFIVAVYRVLKNRFKTFRQSLLLAVTYIPTICVLVWQYVVEFEGTYNNGDERGMGFKVGGSWAMYSDNIPLAIILAALFPIIMLIIHRKQLRESEQFRFSWQIFLISLLIYFFLIEKGYRAKDGNFGWGYLYGLFLVFFTSIEEWIKDVRELIMIGGAKSQKIVVVLETFLMLVHFAFGIHYLQLLFMGYDYKLPWY